MQLKTFTHNQVIQMIRAEIKKSALSLSEFAESKGISRQYLNNILAKRDPPTPLGYKKVAAVRFVKVAPANLQAGGRR